MKKSSIVACAVGAALICAAPISVQWSPEKTLSLSVDSAGARVGRPLTPGSVAGVARRTDRRAVYNSAGHVYHPNVYHPRVYR
jgi:hypothetical protein